MFRIALRSVISHRLRLALTAMSVILGVAFVTGMLMLTAALDRTFSEIFASSAQDVSVARTPLFDTDRGGPPSGDLYIDEQTVSKIAELPAVAAAEGSASGSQAFLVDANGEVVGGNGPPAFAITWLTEPDLQVAQITNGEPPTEADHVVVDDITFPRLDIPIGSPISVVGEEGTEEFVLVGTFSIGSTGGLAGATVSAFTPETAQRLFTEPGQWDVVEIATADGFTDDEAAAQIAEELGDGYDITTRQEQVDQATSALQEGLGFFNALLVGFGGIALFVAAFLIYNTFAMLIAQRGRELALLRVLGATRRQILGSVLMEAMLVGLVAIVVGIALGFGLANGLRLALTAIGLELSSGISLTLEAVQTAAILGLVVTLGSALLPALRASRTRPIEALRQAGAADESMGLIRGLIGILVLIGSGWWLTQALLGERTADTTGLAALVFLVGAILVAPALARLFAVAAAPLLGLIGGVAGRLAGRNAARSPRRVAATAAALMIGLSLAAGATVIVASARQSINDLIDRTFVGDVLVSAQNGRGFSTKIADSVRDVEGVQFVISLADGDALVDGEPDRISAVGGGPVEEVAAVGLTGLDIDQLTGQAVANEVWAADRGLTTGDAIEVQLSAEETLEFTLLTTFEDNPLLPGLVVPLPQFREAGGDERDDLLFIAFAPGVDSAAVSAAVDDAISVNPLLRVQDQSQLKEEQSASLNQLLYFVYAMLGLSVVIAALGVVNTMALSVFERTREIGLLRAVGASRRQMRRMVRWEAVLVAVLGGLLGVAAGVFIGSALRATLADEGIDVLVIPEGSLALVMVAAGLIGLIGAILPARRAARLDILRAIATE